MDIYVAADIRMKVNEMPEHLMEWLKGRLTLNNPAFERVAKYGYSTTNTPQYLYLYMVSNGNFIIPRGMGNELITYLRQRSLCYELLDNRALHPAVEFKSEITLRDYQENAVNRVLKGTQGFLVSPCGSGKTVMMVEMMTRIKQPTLFIVHQKELMEQIISTAVNLTDIERGEIGVIGSGKRMVGKRMTVATVQTLNRLDISEYEGLFGAVFIDEAHHLAAKSFYEVISRFRGCYRLAVSATPNRADGLTEMVYACTGPVVHEITQDLVPTIIPSLKVVKTNFECASKEYADIVKRLVADPHRNQVIIETIKKESEGNYGLVLSDRIEHLKRLKALIAKDLPSLKIEILTGSTPKKERNQIMERARNKDIDILLATQLAREGLDIPHLNRLFLTYPKKSAASVQQEVGRIMRPAEGKKNAVVFDFLDNKSGLLLSQFRKRKVVYSELGVKAM